AARDDLLVRAVLVDARDDGVALLVADVAGCADGNIQLPVGAEGDELPAVVTVVRVVIGDNHGFGRIVEMRVDVVETEDAADLGNVEIAVVPGDAVRRFQSLGDDDAFLGLAVAVPVDNRPYLVTAAI